MEISFKVFVGLFLATILLGRVASAQTFTNGSFETGDFTGWQTSGTPTVAGSPPTPADGSFQALINSTGTTASGIYAMSNSATAAQLNTFLGTTLPGNANGSPVNGEAIQQTFSTTGGATVTFSYKYVSREAYQNGYDETGYVLNGVFHYLADSNTPGQTTAEATGFFTGGLTYKTITITVGPGTNTLGFVAYNTGNSAAPTGLFVDDVVVTPLITAAFTDVDPAGASLPQVTGVFGNNVVGFYNSSSFIYDGTTTSTLTVPGSSATAARGISGKNVVGFYKDSMTVEHGFLYDGITYTTLDPAGSIDTEALAVSGNNIVGFYTDAQAKEHGFFYNGGVYTTLDPPGSAFTIALAVSGINVAGQYGTSDGHTHGFYYDGTTFTTVDPPASTMTQVTGVAGNLVTGWYVDSSGLDHGFLFNGVVYTTIDPPASSQGTQITAIYGQDVVGSYTDASSVQHGFLYDGNTYTTIDPPGSNYARVTAISGTTLAGNFGDGNGINHGFLAELNAGKTAAVLTLDQFSTTYDGTPKSVTTPTVPASLNVDVTYNGSTTPPTNVGDYAVVASIDDATYQGTATGTLSIGKENASISLQNLSATYDGTPKFATATTTPSNLNVVFAYSGTTTPTNAGSYSVVATINDPIYQGTAAGTLTIGQATGTVTLQSLAATYDGTPKSATATTNPPNLDVTFTYDGNTAAPSAVGSYTVVGTISDPNYVGNATDTLVISAPTTGTFGAWESSYGISGQPTDIPLNDGVPNLFKYLYDIDPTRPMNTTDRTAFPVLGMATANSVNYLTLTYRQNAAENDLVVKLQTSTDLQNWTTVDPPPFSQQVGTFGTAQDPILQIGVQANGGRQFIRLQITLP